MNNQYENIGPRPLIRQYRFNSNCLYSMVRAYLRSIEDRKGQGNGRRYSLEAREEARQEAMRLFNEAVALFELELVQTEILLLQTALELAESDSFLG